MEVLGLSQATVAGWISLALIACFGVLSVVLEHHWNRYEVDSARRRQGRKIYYIGAGIIILLMLLAIIPLLP